MLSSYRLSMFGLQQKVYPIEIAEDFSYRLSMFGLQPRELISDRSLWIRYRLSMFGLQLRCRADFRSAGTQLPLEHVRVAAPPCLFKLCLT